MRSRINAFAFALLLVFGAAGYVPVATAEGAQVAPALAPASAVPVAELKKELANKGTGTCKATTGSGNASAVDCSWNMIKHFNYDKDGQVEGRNEAFSLTSHLPISSGSSEATVGDLDGLLEATPWAPALE